MKVNIIKKENKTARINKVAKEKNIHFIYFLCALFFIGMMIGSLYLKNKIANDFFKNENLFSNIDKLKTSYDARKVTINSLIKNVIILIGFWIVGFSIIGAPLLVLYILFEGFSTGITISYVIYFLGAADGYRLVYSSMYLPKIFLIFSIILLCDSAVKVTQNILKNKKEIKVEFVRHTAMCLIAIIFLVCSSFLEGWMGEIAHKIILSINSN